MKRKTTEDVTELYQRLFERPPHIMPQLSRVRAGEWNFTPNIQRQMVAHLRSCNYCQLAVETMVAASFENDDDPTSVEEVRTLLARFKAINHSIQEQDERIAAYAEALETRGPDEANRRFPIFAEHLKHCQICAVEVDDTRNALVEAVSVGLIPPLETNIQTRG